ncbi:Gfo/Idh/MocA family protein [Acidicapsa acidisoli]|uniref:Gfo/Idh/MocA family protein n=1 Tax=Acidicapsa acidisoli TaxID=1615681 RepID=UPI0021E08980|nr:Gfo/Idh/MocA family oxidoreductase [Acidicapsa acidisoli]
MRVENYARRSFLKAMGSAGMLTALPDAAHGLYGAGNGPIVHEVAAPFQGIEAKPQYSIRFSVIGLDHYHIMSMTAAAIRGGGELVSVYATDPKAIADFIKLYPQAKLARSEQEILDDPSIKLVAGAQIPNLRAPLGIRVMHHGKDYLSDKPAITTLEQLADVRAAIKQTGRIFAIMYSERLEVRAAVKAGDLIQQGAIGKVVQTINIAPHKVNDITRPAWFWDPEQYGGILCDIGSHQADQFVYYTGSTTAAVTASQIANVNHPAHPRFQDFGDMMLHGNGGAGYVRVDWFTPDGLGTWGDGRLFILGTEGYIELRKYVDIAGRSDGNHLFVVDAKQTKYIDCSKVELPFGPQFVSDIVNRTHTGQNQEQALLTAELVLLAQKNAKVLTFPT